MVKYSGILWFQAEKLPDRQVVTQFILLAGIQMVRFLDTKADILEFSVNVVRQAVRHNQVFRQVVSQFSSQADSADIYASQRDKQLDW